MTHLHYSYKEYDPIYVNQFEQERKEIAKVLPKGTRIEHVGSTAVPGLGGKGAIDIAVWGGKNYKDFIKKLEKIGFVYDPTRDGDKKDKFMCKIIKENNTERRVNLHLCVDITYFESYLVMLNYLKMHSKVRDEYECIKKEGAKKANGDGKKYFQHKEAFLKETYQKAMEYSKKQNGNKIELTKNEISNILSNYSVGKYKSHKKLWWSLNNILLLVKTNEGNYILKFFKDSDPKHTLWTLEIMEKLRKEGLPVPKTFTTRDGKLVCDYNEKHLVIQEYIEGKIIHKANNAFVRDFAKNIGLVNKSLLRVGLSNKHLWKKIGHQFEPSDYRSSDVIEGFNFVNSENKLLAELNQNVKKDKLRKSIIHADYTLNNLVVNDKKVLGILDWGNLHEDYLVFDTAIAMGHLFFANKLAKKEKIKFFMKEYERHVKLNANEKRAIYYFIKIRLLSGIVWCELQRQKHQDKSKKLTKWLKNTIKNYRDFDNISLKEFLQLL